MTLSTYLLSLGYTPEKFNTCNAWGFGGGIGTSYTLGNIEVRIATAYYRHIRPAKYVTVAKNGYRIADFSSMTVDQFNQIVQSPEKGGQ